ncbi:MAG: hypothetical protein H8J66_14755 [Nitrospira sp.]|nr:hypothetical protein [Nitrospira sp.]
MDDEAVKGRCEELANFHYWGRKNALEDFLKILYRAAYADGLEQAAKECGKRITSDLMEQGCTLPAEIGPAASSDLARNLSVLFQQQAKELRVRQ